MTNRNVILSGLAVVLVAVEVTVLFGITPADPDLYGHLTFGSEILKRGTVPTQDVYSFTAGNTYWINHEWLSELLYAIVWKTGGFKALHVLKILLLGLYFYLFYVLLEYLLDELSTLKYAFLSGLFGLVLYPYLFVRPQLVTFLMTQLLLLLFLRHLATGETHVFALPVLFVLWTNAHGGFVAGIGLILVVWAVVLYWYPQRRRSVSLVVVLSLVGTLVNPYGYSIYEQLLRTFSNPYTDRLIQDWQSILHVDVALHPVVLTGVLTYLVYALTFLYSRKGRRRYLLFFLTTVCFIVGLTDARNMVFVAFVGLPALAEITPEFTTPQPTTKHRWILAGVLLLSVSLSLVGYLDRNPDNYFPDESVAFLEKSELTGNLAVPFNWGQYSIFHLHPKIRVSLDGRYDTVYPLEVFEDFELKAFQGHNWRAILRRYGTDYVLVPPTSPLHEKLINAESAKQLFSGGQAGVFKLTDD